MIVLPTSPVWFTAGAHRAVPLGRLPQENNGLRVSNETGSILHTRSLPCSPPRQDSGYTQNLVDSGASYAVALHDFPAGKDINNELVEPLKAFLPRCLSL